MAKNYFNLLSGAHSNPKLEEIQNICILQNILPRKLTHVTCNIELVFTLSMIHRNFFAPGKKNARDEWVLPPDILLNLY